MGLMNYIRDFKEKVVGKAKEDYIPVEKINTRVQTYGNKTMRERLADIKSKVRTYKKEKQLKASEKAEIERNALKQELSDLKLKNQVAKERAKLPQSGVRGFLQKYDQTVQKLSSEGKRPQIKVKQPGEGNIFGGKGPFEP